MKFLISIFSLLCIRELVAQVECNAVDYEECGESVETIGYLETCNTKQDQCADCIGCNQVCGWSYGIGWGTCNADPVCSVALYIEAARVIENKKDCGGYLYLCCEDGASDNSAEQCVGCQQANFAGILCGVYEGLKDGLGWDCDSGNSQKLKSGKNKHFKSKMKKINRDDNSYGDSQGDDSVDDSNKRKYIHKYDNSQEDDSESVDSNDNSYSYGDSQGDDSNKKRKSLINYYQSVYGNSQSQGGDSDSVDDSNRKRKTHKYDNSQDQDSGNSVDDSNKRKHIHKYDDSYGDSQGDDSVDSNDNSYGDSQSQGDDNSVDDSNKKRKTHKYDDSYGDSQGDDSVDDSNKRKHIHKYDNSQDDDSESVDSNDNSYGDSQSEGDGNSVDDSNKRRYIRKYDNSQDDDSQGDNSVDDSAKKRKSIHKYDNSQDDDESNDMSLGASGKKYLVNKYGVDTIFGYTQTEIQMYGVSLLCIILVIFVIIYMRKKCKISKKFVKTTDITPLLNKPVPRANISV